MSAYASESTRKHMIDLDADPRFDIQSQDAVISIKNIARTSQVLVLSANGSSIDNFSFSNNFDHSNFIGSGVTFRLEVPLKFTVPTAITGVTDKNFISKVFKDFSHLCLRSGGLLNVMESFSVTLNNMTYTVNNIQKLHPAIFKFYEDMDINSWMEASQHDRYQNYESYQADERYNLLQVTSPAGSSDLVNIPVKVGANEENIFLGGFKSNYNTRTPLFTFDSVDADNKTFHVKMTQECYLPFAFFGLPGNDLSIYGVGHFALKINLTKNFAGGELFSLAQRQSGAGPTYTYGFDFSAIELDNTAVLQSDRAKLLVPYWNSPEYISEEMTDPTTNNIKPYSFSFTKVDISSPVEVSVTNGALSSFNITLNPLSVVPRAIYIYALRKKDTSLSSISVANTPTTFARIDALSLQFNDSLTMLPPDPLGLYMLSKSNDLNMDRLSALYTAGFPVKLEVQHDISGGSSALYTGLARRVPIKISGAIRDLRTKDIPGVTNSTAVYEIIVAYAWDAYCDHMNGSFDIKDSLVVDSSGLGDRRYHINLYSNRMRKVNMIGGFWGTIWRGIKSGASHVAKYLKDNPSILNAIGSTIDPSLGTVGNTIGTLLPGAGFGPNTSGGSSIRPLGAGSVGKTVFRNNTSDPFTKPNF